MKKLQQKMREFMQGRYGVDEFGRFLLIAGFIVYAIGTILRSALLMTFGLMGFFVFIFRSLSRNHLSRMQENNLFTRYCKLWKMRFEQRKEYKIFMCKRCGKFIRVPKGKGKVEITCPSCKNKEIHRT
ncbi:MAG: hypothetical protein ACI4HI_08720 [Lachnospiraceae bacterium]